LTHVDFLGLVEYHSQFHPVAYIAIDKVLSDVPNQIVADLSLFKDGWIELGLVEAPDTYTVIPISSYRDPTNGCWYPRSKIVGLIGMSVRPLDDAPFAPGESKTNRQVWKEGLANARHAETLPPGTPILPAHIQNEADYFAAAKIHEQNHFDPVLHADCTILAGLNNAEDKKFPSEEKADTYAGDVAAAAMTYFGKAKEHSDKFDGEWVFDSWDWYVHPFEENFNLPEPACECN
jgi:hypothetical protein